jgi:VanZ family protein
MLKWLPVSAWVIAICFMSFTPLEKVSLPQFHAADKLAHVGMYALLEWLIYVPTRNSFNQFKLVSGLAVIFSAFTELIQHYFILNRYGEWGDFIANCLGLLCLFIVLKKRFAK